MGGLLSHGATHQRAAACSGGWVGAWAEWEHGGWGAGAWGRARGQGGVACVLSPKAGPCRPQVPRAPPHEAPHACALLCFVFRPPLCPFSTAVGKEFDLLRSELQQLQQRLAEATAVDVEVPGEAAEELLRAIEHSEATQVGGTLWVSEGFRLAGPGISIWPWMAVVILM